jgi:hypothetical protein
LNTLLIISDCHINSSVGLCQPALQLDDGGSYSPSKTQRWINDCWAQMIDTVTQMRLGRLITVFNGDICEGDTKRRTYQVISRNPANILSHAADVIDPIAKMSDKLYFVRGTEAHVGKSAWYEEQMGRDFSGAKEPSTKARSWYHLKLELDGVRLDIAHHTNMSGLPWTSPQAASKLAARVLMTYAKRDERPPHLVIRGHVHRWADSHDDYPVRAVISGGWQAATGYISKIEPGALGELGAILVHCDRGRAEVHKIRFDEPRRSWTKA